MITAYFRAENQILELTVEAADALPENLCWLDLDEPSDLERASVSEKLGIEVPSQAEMREIEVSSRLYVEGNVIHLTTSLLVGADSPEPELAELTIIITPKYLVVVRFAAPKSVAIFTARAKRNPALVADVNNAALTLLDAIADRTADTLEMTGRQVNVLSRQVFPSPTALSNLSVRRRRWWHRRASEAHESAPQAPLKDLLYGVGRTGDMLHRSYHSINGMIRMTAFLAHVMAGRLSPEQMVLMQTLQSDLKSLHDHADFMIQETTFLLDAVLGQINGEQNDIFRFLMMSSTLFLPASLLAGIYGMNMPGVPGMETHWVVWVVFGVMVLSAIGSLVYFKRRGWW